MKKILIILVGLFATQLIAANQSFAQWGIGAGVEIRDEDPTSGVGIKIEKEIFSKVPVLDFNLRGHFSWFYDSDTESIFEEALNTEINVYDYGVAFVMGVKLGIVKPYVGAGLGSEQFHEELNSYSEENFYWNGFGGAEITLLPYLKPFIEFRYSKFTDTDEIEFDYYNRLAIGLNFRF